MSEEYFYVFPSGGSWAEKLKKPFPTSFRSDIIFLYQ